MQRRCFSRAVQCAALVALAICFAVPECRAQFSGNEVSSASAFSIPQSQLIQPDALSRLLQAGGAHQPMVLQVGSHVMFSQAHVPGAIYAGQGSQASGLQLLESKVSSTPKNKPIVLYCGCCPWNHCPNVGPAYKRLRDLGFTNVKVLYLANNFGDDWAYKGYRVEQGQ
ncbi:MAG: rhodanese-like domain-containing protein [Terracidiphilus sp.]|jgi:rhodanese-related sulfurtransferase